MKDKSYNNSKGWEKIVESYRKEKEKWATTPEGQKYQMAQQQEEEQIRKVVERVLEIDATEQIMFKSEEAQKLWNHALNSSAESFCGTNAMKYARCWAKYMQVLIAEGKEVVDVAEYASVKCDAVFSVSKLQKRYAIQILIRVWKYGGELENWSKEKHGINNEDSIS